MWFGECLITETVFDNNLVNTIDVNDGHEAAM